VGAQRHAESAMNNHAMPRRPAKKGVVIKLFGVILIFLGVLDSMLSWRGGFAVSESFMLLFAAGILLYAFGAIRGGNRSRYGKPGDAGLTRRKP